jgi:MRG-binding protein
MPPKKRARVVTNAGGSPPAVSTPKPKPAAEPVFSDGWTDEQETTLFKAIAIYKLKPAGLHKHFRVIGIAELMKNHGVSSANTDIPGIWKKLDTLYNLEELDEREDEDESVFGAGGDFSGGGVSGSGSATESVFSLDAAGAEGGEVEFGLPWDTFGELMMARRIDPSSLDSPRLSEVSLVPTTTNDDDAEEMVDEGEGDGLICFPCFFFFI